MLTQEFQWSRSLTVLLLGLVPSHLRRLPWKLRARFLFALSFYPLISLTTCVGLLLPPIAAITGVPWVNANYFEFVLRWASITIWLFLMALVLRRQGLLRPNGTPLVSWENWLYVLARWPYIARGVTAAAVQRVRRRTVTFRITPKGTGGLEPLPVKTLIPYLLITGVLSTSGLIGEHTGDAVGYVFLCLLGSLFYAVVLLAVPLLHAREAAHGTGVSTALAIRRTVAVPVALGVAALVPLTVACVSYPAYFAGVYH
jgi:hypothetical protein